MTPVKPTAKSVTSKGSVAKKQIPVKKPSVKKQPLAKKPPLKETVHKPAPEAELPTPPFSPVVKDTSRFATLFESSPAKMKWQSTNGIDGGSQNNFRLVRQDGKQAIMTVTLPIEYVDMNKWGVEGTDPSKIGAERRLVLS